MTRRRLVALVSAIVLASLGILVFATGFFVTHTSMGRDKLRDLIKPFIAGKFPNATFYLGQISGSFIGSITLDTLAIRDKRGELFLSTGRVTVGYNWRDLVDNRVKIQHADVQHPYLHFVQHSNGEWNFKEIFAGPKNNVPSLPKDLNTRNWGDYIVVDSARTRGATFLLTLPWHPDDSLRGVKRDSVIRAHLTNPAKAVTKTFDGYGRTYAWRNAHGLISHARLADPDSDKKFGQQFRVDTLSADEFEPTFKFRNVTANVRHQGDSIWFDVPHFDMPASTGTGQGRVWWGSELPTRYDIAIRGDSVSLDDVNWVYPTLPRIGGGKLDLAIKNDPDPKKLQIVDFKLTKMDVRSTKSHLIGDMTFSIGAPILLVRNVDLRAEPMDFDLIRTLNGKPFPVDWQGQLFGTVKAGGGPLTHFYVDDARGRFEDAHVPGAVSRFAAKGELDILQPAFTAFHGLYVDAGSIDLRSIEYLYPAFPRLKGFVSGTATLDSSWLDVRFSNAHLTHQDGPGEPTQVSGSGRITYGDPFMIYDVSLDAQPLSLTMLARSYPIPLRGLVSGPIHAKGSSPDLELSMSLQGNEGAFSYDGRLDIDSIGGYGVQGRGQFSALNLATLLDNAKIPTGVASGHYDIDVAGKTAASLEGSAHLDVERTVIDSINVYPSYASLRFGGGKLTVDSMFVRTAAARLTASGGIGLPKGIADSLSFTVTADSLGGLLRPYLAKPDTIRLGAAATLPDSMTGFLKLQGVAAGTLDAFDVAGQLLGTDLYFNKQRADTVVASFAVRDALHSRVGSAQIRMKAGSVAGVVLDSINGDLGLTDSTHARFSVAAVSHNGPTATAAGTWSAPRGLHTLAIDSLGFGLVNDQWRLAGPAHLAIDSVGNMQLDSLVLRNADSASIALSGSIPSAGGATLAQLRGSRLPLRDFGVLAQLPDTIIGLGDVAVSITGTKAKPQITSNAMLRAIKWNGVDIDSVAGNGQYRDGRINVALNMSPKGQPVVSGTASLPYDVALFSIKPRNDSLSAALRADKTDLSIFQTLLPRGVTLSGVLSVDSLNVHGTLRAPVFGGGLRILNGSAQLATLGVAWTDINGAVSGSGTTSGQDSIQVNLNASSQGDISGTVSIGGWVKNLLQPKANQPLAITITANSFHIYDRRTVADVYLTTTQPLRLTGSVQSAVLTGAMFVDRSAIFLADRDLARKRAVQLIADASARSGGVNLPASFSTLMTNLTISNVPVRLGNDVRLRSAEANVRLAGELQLTTSTAQSTRTLASTGQLVPRLALEGSLNTVGGTYNLNLGLVQREFQVLPDGKVAFNGPPDNPTLDIRAQYNVKQVRDRDLGILVHLYGPLLPNPVISFQSTAEYDISQSDLLSYMITGRPGFDFSSNQTQVLSAFLAPTLSAVTSSALRQSLGSRLDMIQFQLGTGGSTSESGTQSTVGNQFSNYLFGSTIGAEQQFGNNLFLSVNTGLCQFSGNNSPALNSLVGAKVEYRFQPTFSTQVAYDPPTYGRTGACGTGQSIIGLVPTPGQFSLGFFHTWRF
jgi:translocation and assembly module TamB